MLKYILPIVLLFTLACALPTYTPAGAPPPAPTATATALPPDSIWGKPGSADLACLAGEWRLRPSSYEDYAGALVPQALDGLIALDSLLGEVNLSFGADGDLTYTLSGVKAGGSAALDLLDGIALQGDLSLSIDGSATANYARVDGAAIGLADNALLLMDVHSDLAVAAQVNGRDAGTLGVTPDVFVPGLSSGMVGFACQGDRLEIAPVYSGKQGAYPQVLVFDRQP